MTKKTMFMAQVAATITMNHKHLLLDRAQKLVVTMHVRAAVLRSIRNVALSKLLESKKELFVVYENKPHPKFI
jgi:ABC-type xylose transport system substrate-binding protein